MQIYSKCNRFSSLFNFFYSILTGKSLSEALIFASPNPQFDDRLFIESQVQYMKIPSSNLGRRCCVQKLFLTTCSPLFWKKKSIWQKFTCTIKFRYFEKTEIGRFFQIFVAFSQYLNFNNNNSYVLLSGFENLARVLNT